MDFHLLIELEWLLKIIVVVIVIVLGIPFKKYCCGVIVDEIRQFYHGPLLLRKSEKERKKELYCHISVVSVFIYQDLKKESATKTFTMLIPRFWTILHFQKCPLIMQFVWLGMQIGKSHFIGRIIWAKHLKTKHRGACQCLSPYAQSLWSIYPTAQKKSCKYGKSI